VRKSGGFFMLLRLTNDLSYNQVLSTCNIIIILIADLVLVLKASMELHDRISAGSLFQSRGRRRCNAAVHANPVQAIDI
jgi:hypothetical protein